MDPRKPIHRPDEAEQDRIRRIALRHLLTVTEQGAREIGCTGAAFVVMSIPIWLSELSELNPRAAAKMMQALGVIFDPAAGDIKKRNAERHRRAAVAAIFAALDLEMNPPQGRA
jgi:hypothetical protein